MFNKITFNSADTSTWPQFIMDGGYNSSVDKPNLTTHGKYGTGLAWVDVNGRDISIYDSYSSPIYQNDKGEVVQGEFVTAEDKAKFWGEGQMSSFTFVNKEGEENTVTLNWGKPLVDGTSLPAEENNDEEEPKEEPKPIQGGGDDPAELEDGEKPKEEPIETPDGGLGIINETEIRLKEINSILQTFGYTYNKEKKIMVYSGEGDEPTTVPNSLIENSDQVKTIVLLQEFNELISQVESKEEPKPIGGGEEGEEEPSFEEPTDVASLANFLQSFNAEIIAYNEALNQIESVLIETKEGLKKTENLDEEFTSRKSRVETKVEAINVKQAEEIAKVEKELEEEVTKAEELKTEMQIKVTEVESRNQKIVSDPIISKLTENVSSSLRARHDDLKTSISKVNELMVRDVKVEKATEIENAKQEKEVVEVLQKIKGGVRTPNTGTNLVDDYLSTEAPLVGKTEIKE